jgi:hypothetical protein
LLRLSVCVCVCDSDFFLSFFFAFVSNVAFFE